MTIAELIKKYKLSEGIHKDYYEHFQSKKLVLTHRACEKIANKEGIVMKSIQVLNSERDFVRFLVTMEKDGIVISSVGEADSKNCKNIYYGCMGEKRGVDRCVLKLIDAHEFAFSEVDFADVNEQSFEVGEPKKPHTRKKASSIPKSEAQSNSPLDTSLAWREEKFLPLQTKVKNCSNSDVKKWYYDMKNITDKRSAELVKLEFDYRCKIALEKKGGK